MPGYEHAVPSKEKPRREREKKEHNYSSAWEMTNLSTKSHQPIPVSIYFYTENAIRLIST